MKHLFYGKLMQEKPIDANKILGIGFDNYCPDYFDLKQPEAFIERMEGYIKNPRSRIIFVPHKVKDVLIQQKEFLNRQIHKGDNIKIRGKDCVVEDIKYDLDSDSMNYYTSYIVDVLKVDEELMQQEAQKIIKCAKEALEKFKTNNKSYIKKKWWQFWK